MGLKTILAEKAAEAVTALYGAEVDPAILSVQKTNKDFDGDLTLVVFPLLRHSRKSPELTANDLGAWLKEAVPEVADFGVVKGFLNLTISNAHWQAAFARFREDDHLGLPAPGSGRKIMLEYSSPNTNKPLHLGHVRNNLLGWSVAEILKANGHELIKVNLVNDRGIHICKSMLAWQRFGEGETPASSGTKGDKLVGKYYVAFEQALREEAEALLAQWNEGAFEGTDEAVAEKFRSLQSRLEAAEDDKAQKAVQGELNELSRAHAPLQVAAREMLRQWEQKDPEVRALWEQMNGWVYEGFNVTYARMGADFDRYYYESETYLLGKQAVETGLDRGVFYQREDGSVWCDLRADGLDEKLLLRSDGTAVYMTQDLGTAMQRFADYPGLEKLAYTVGDEQDYHFKVLFLILKKLGFDWADGCQHLSYGMVDLPSGKMKSREGKVVDADDLMDEVVDRAAAKTREKGIVDDLTPEAQSALFETLGLGALKYFILKVNPQKRMLFDPEESVALEGDTGPFIQYSHARIRAIVRAAGTVSNGSVQDQPLHEREKELVMHLVDYPAHVAEAGADSNPAVIGAYAFDLAKLYNQFYQSCPILKAESDSLRAFRVALSEQTGSVLKHALGLLGIQAPERM